MHRMIPQLAGLRFSHSQWPAVAIAAGVVLLTAAVVWPVLPAVTGMALVALGATGATVARYRGRMAMTPALLVHATMYTTLYALFIGASLHAAARVESGIDFVTLADLATSIGPMALAASLIVDQRMR